eukprot:CAMPEP_0206187120 /NCGR_PEP_ID=MMETSP0166-20121206/2812_1 /ASSEMBLY_ACC=CAM_ASM_000260 /TAXON_ID=95228 /ORGANISM="Vannella robusta, Strain DIVA3 518/3/11/1/6" /LENGTH=253 /DNA_ID=CAMNT_0053602641 /DNA_START=89 /DNA_END=846 /DNA_ORIENTATION=-
MTKQHFDMLVIGGGATGSGIALEAVRRGLSVALIQSSDFSSGTSSRYPRLLLQGGIGFRESGFRARSLRQFCLDDKAAIERPKYLQQTKHYVREYDVHVIQGATDNLFYFVASLFLRFISVRFLSPLSPFRKRGMTSLIYKDHLQQDSRVNVALITTATAAGAICANYCRVVSLVDDGAGKVSGATFLNRISGETCAVKADLVVNATGANCDFIHQLLPESMKNVENPGNKEKLGAPKVGFHLVLNKPVVEKG